MKNAKKPVKPENMPGFCEFIPVFLNREKKC